MITTHYVLAKQPRTNYNSTCATGFIVQVTRNVVNNGEKACRTRRVRVGAAPLPQQIYFIIGHAMGFLLLFIEI